MRCTVPNATVTVAQNKLLVSSPVLSTIRGKHRFEGPILLPTFRHRCCVADVPFVVADHNQKEECMQRSSTPTYVLGLPNFPQYWHTFHDGFMALYATIVEEEGIDMLHGRDRIIAVVNVEDPEEELSRTGFLSHFQLLSKHRIVHARELAGICFERLILGVSDGLNFYNPVPEASTKGFLNFLYSGLGIMAGGALRSFWSRPMASRPLVTIVARRETRRIVNRADLEGMAVELGFAARSVFLEDLSFVEQVRSFGMEGREWFRASRVRCSPKLTSLPQSTDPIDAPN